MKTTSKTILVTLSVGILVGSTCLLAAQETTSAQEPTATATTQVDATASNGARPGDSHVRIVRLSDVRGKLALDRQTGNGFEQTMQNMPIVEGERLQTADGYAEVEFEDNSTIRLAPNSRVDFPLLALRSSGAKASTMSVLRGTVYASTESTKGNEFLLETGSTTLTVAPSTHLRLEVEDGKTIVSVFNGNVEVAHDGETTQVSKKETLRLEGGQTSVIKKVAETPFDAWDKESMDYHARYSRANAFAGSGNSFGLSDLNYYGSFSNVGGCGQIWQPYLVSAAWSPYSNGLWALYPGAGYSWVSPYPWGWLPYHSGSWAFCQGVGWGWQPGGAWNGLNNIANGYGGAGALNGGAINKTQIHSPLRPAIPAQPAAGAVRSSLVIANQTPIKVSKEDTPGNFVFQRDSAGLGVPRGSLGGLNKISNHVEQHGSANMQVYAAPAGGPGHEMSGRGPAVLRQGSPGEAGAGWRGNGNQAGARQGPDGANSGARQGPAGVSSGARQGSSGGAGSIGGVGGSAPSYHGSWQPSGGGAPMGSPAGSAGGGGGAARGPK